MKVTGNSLVDSGINWYFEVFHKYAQFEGRARRKEYWTFVLFNYFFAIVMLLAYETSVETKSMMLNFLILIGAIYLFAIIVPSLSVTVRRLHDTNRSGYWILVKLIPFMGPFVFFWLMIQKSDPSVNKYGPNPLYNDPFNPPFPNATEE